MTTGEPDGAEPREAAEAPAATDSAATSEGFDPPTTLQPAATAGDTPAGDVAAEPWSVYDARPADWTAYVEALDRWKQGDLVLDVPVIWLMPPGTDPVTGTTNPRTGLAPAFDSTVGVSAVICSQTCDIGATPPGDLHPFVLLAPLVPYSVVANQSRSVAKLALDGRIGYLLPVGPPHGADTERGWFVDLRLLCPMSKAVLLDREPTDAFDDEAQRLAFSEVLAQKFRRAALNPVLSEALPAALEKFVAENVRSSAMTAVEQVRLLVLGGDRLNPTRAQLLVLADDMPLDDEEQEVWRRFQHIAAKLFSEAGLTTAPMVFTDPRSCSAERYRASVPVACGRLCSQRWW